MAEGKTLYTSPLKRVKILHQNNLLEFFFRFAMFKVLFLASSLFNFRKAFFTSLKLSAHCIEIFTWEKLRTSKIVVIIKAFLKWFSFGPV